MIEITQQDIENLSGRPDAPSLLAELVRRLVGCTVLSSQTSEMSFPTEIYREGWDGKLEYEGKNLWVPNGKSFWEYSTAKDIKGKFKSDFDKRAKECASETKSESEFVFVTTRKKPQINIDKKGWGNVRIYGSENLAKWLKIPETASVKEWLAKKIKIPTKGLVSVDVAWRRWAKNGNKPPITESLILADREDSIEKLKEFLENPPTDFFTVYTDSREEAEAFVCASLRKEPELSKYAGNVIVMDENPENIRALTSPADGKKLIFLLRNKEMTLKINDLPDEVRIIVAEHKGTENQNKQSKNYTELRRVSTEKFEEILVEKMGYRQMQARQEVLRYGMSVTVFRRNYSTNPATRQPEWAKDNTADVMVAAALAGAWDSANGYDRAFMAAISQREYSAIENKMPPILHQNDSPIEQRRGIWQIKSHLDALFVLYSRITPHMLDIFLHQAHKMLTNSEQNESRKLIFGVINTIPILSNHQDATAETKVKSMVKDLLDDNFRRFSTSGDLVLLAEAAPEEFLDVLNKNLDTCGENDWEKQHICEALKVLAWESRYFDEIVDILLKLIEQRKFGIDTLYSFFIPWLPQCGANVDSRKRILTSIVDNHPDIGWEVCISMLQTNMGIQNPMPSKRDRPLEIQLKNEEVRASYETAFSHALSLLNNDTDRVVSIIQSTLRLPSEWKSTVVREIQSQYTPESPNEAAKVQDAICNMLYNTNINEENKEEMISLYNALFFDDIVEQNLWLFLSDFPDFPSKSDMPPEEMDQSINEQRQKAINKILDNKGIVGLWELCKLIPSSNLMRFISESVPEEWNDTKRLKCMHDFISQFQCHTARKCFVGGLFFSKIKKEPRFVCDFIAQKKHKKWEQSTVLIFVLSDIFSTKELWEIIDSDIPDIASDYWKELNSFGKKSPANLVYFVQKMIQYGRTTEALRQASFNDFAGMSGKQVMDILEAMANISDISNSHYSYHIRQAFSYIAKKGDVEEDKIIELEFKYYEYMGGVRPHAIFLKLAREPNYFIQIMHRLRNGPTNDDITEIKKVMKWEYLMRSWKIPPGMDKSGNFYEKDFRKWISEVRELASKDEVLLKEVDGYIGKILVHLKDKENSDLPHTAALDILSQEYAENIRRNFMSDIIHPESSFTIRGKGGDQERELADKYQVIAEKMEKKGYSKVAADYCKIVEYYKKQAKIEDDRDENRGW